MQSIAVIALKSYTEEYSETVVVIGSMEYMSKYTQFEKSGVQIMNLPEPLKHIVFNDIRVALYIVLL